ncbi:transcriptional repressor [Microsporum audouinii]
MSRGPEKQRMVSILNNDDNPSFAVRPSKSSKYRQEPAAYSSQLQAWPTSSPESHFYSYELQTHGSLPPQYAMPHSLPHGYEHRERGSAAHVLQDDRQIAERDRLSPRSSYSNLAEYTAPPTTKKNKHACPYAASHGCPATFTTSGHAARHGKKHTGEKRVHCPVCNKAFTRKDNMKQHQRTHRESGADTDFEGQDQNVSDAAYSQSPGSSIAYPPAYDPDASMNPRYSQHRRHSSRSATSYDTSPRYLSRELADPLDPEDERRRRSSAYRSDSVSSGLDSLAIASTNSSYGSRHISKK